MLRLSGLHRLDSLGSEIIIVVAILDVDTMQSDVLDKNIFESVDVVYNSLITGFRGAYGGVMIISVFQDFTLYYLDTNVF
jgi:hypothetical protein